MRRAVPVPYLIAVLCVILLVPPADALPPGVRVLDPIEVLDLHSARDETGALCLRDVRGTLRRFVISPTDPRISNPGSGRFHPVAEGRILDALVRIDPRFLDTMEFEVLILPYPVENPLSSWAMDGVIYLSPGVYEHSEGQVHFLVAHEVGHLVQREVLPHADGDGWNEYRRLRGIEDTARYHSGAGHRDRPNEIFAEDFRFLFGGRLAREASPHENPSLASPDQVPGLETFFLGRIGAASPPVVAEVALLAPNPFTSGARMRLTLPGLSSIAAATIHDITGRAVRALEDWNAVEIDRFETLWDGADAAGRPLPQGVYFLRVEDSGTPRNLSFRLIR